MSRTAILSGISAVAFAAALAAGAGFAADPDTADAALLVPAFAETEPEVEFPTCVGIARLEGGAVTPIPIEEAGVWDEQFDLLGEAVGAKVDVLSTTATDPVQAVADIRNDAGAAGLDFVVVYEVAYDEAEGSGPTAIQNLRVFPTFEGEEPTEPARAAGAAILLDVDDGKMYGVASATAMDSEIERPEAGYYAREGAEGDAFTAVVIELAHEVETAFVGMMIKSGLPEPQTAEAEVDPEDLTEEEIIARADREIRAAYGEQAQAENGC